MHSVATKTLLVDDNKTFLNAVLGVLQRVRGINVVGCASDGMEALDLVLRLRPELILLDISMPRLGGLELAAQLSALTDAPTIIMLSMHDSDEYRQAAALAGASAFVKKDNFMTELVPLLDRLISDKQKLQHHEA